MLNRLRAAILGVHPHNTLFSFNWHNVRHINDFLRQQSKKLRENTGSMAKNFVVADIGGGNSPYYEYFGPYASKYLSVDINISASDSDKRPIIFIEGTAEAIPLEDASVDLVLCNQVLEHVIDPAKSASEIWRILKPGGIFIGSVPHISPVHLEPYDFRRFTDLGVNQLLDNQGFQNITINENGGVFSTASFMIWMDLILTNRRDGKSQGFRSNLALLLAPFVGFTNFMGLIFDRLLSTGRRSPANLCWYARRPN